MDRTEKGLIRGVQELYEPNTVIIIGNGAIERGWDPLLNLCRVKGKFPIDLEETQLTYLLEDDSSLAHMLANASFMYRAFRTEYYRTNILLGSSSAATNALINYLNRFLQFREDVATEYLKSGPTLRDIPQVVRDALKKDDTAIITTNWDLCLWDRPNDFPRLIHLHGAAFNQDSIIFPTEFSPDEMSLISSLSGTRKASYQGFVSQNAHNFVYTYARGWWHRKLIEAHSSSIKWLESATKVITWGLSCNIYDAELNSVVSTAANSGKPIEKLIVVNTDSKSPLLQSKLFHARNKTTWINPVPKTPCGVIREYRVNSNLLRK
jgi:hypothetical protein